VCPADKGELDLNVVNKDWVSEGEFECTKCGRKYEIRDGVPYFFEKGNGFEWGNNISEQGIVNNIAESLDEENLTWAKIIALSNLFLNKLKDRKESIDTIFRVIEKVVAITSANSQLQAYLTQAATAARYDIEIYRGTFTLPERILRYVVGNFESSQGIVVEGACATGECLMQLARFLDSSFYLGLDISGTMVRNAQQKSAVNMLFVQADICSLPIRENSSGIYVLNNVFDRVVDPLEACRQADNILNHEQSELVLSNCDPLQFGYTTGEGKEIIFVPKEKQITLEDGLRIAGFRPVISQKGIWQIETVAYGEEFLQYKSLVGRR